MADVYTLSAQQIEVMSENLHDKVVDAGRASRPGINYIDSPSGGAAHVDLQELHVVMVPYPLQGHINPMMQLAKVLIAEQGVRVTFINNKHNHDRIQQTRSQSSVVAPSCSPSSNIMQPHQDRTSKLQLLWVDNGLPPEYFDYSDLTPSLHEFHLATHNMKGPFKLLLQSLIQKSPPVSCVMFGSFCPWAHTVAAELGIPSIFFWTQSASVGSMCYHASQLADSTDFFPFTKKASPGCDEDEVKPLKARDKVSYIPGAPPLHPSSFPTLLHSPVIKEQFGILQNCAGVIVNSFEELEIDAYRALQAALPFPVSLVGPLVPAAFLEGGDRNDTSVGANLLQEKNDCIQWLDSQRNQSVLYISFGSLFNPSAEDLKGIANGVKASKQPFLWVIRPRSSVHNVANILPQGFMEDTKEYGLIVPWAPQMQVLSHPSVGAFLTHCGWNSTLESVTMGMPMIPFPFSSDQPTNCAYVCDVWKIGMALERDNDGMVRSAEVERVVRTVLQEQEGKEMRKRVADLREAGRWAVRPQGSSSIHMEKLIVALRNQSLRNNIALT
eukprot:c25133_g1_i1 orf=174-1835(-)